MPIPFQRGGSPRIPLNFQIIVHTTENPKNPPFEIGRKSRGSTRWYCFQKRSFWNQKEAPLWKWKETPMRPLKLKGIHMDPSGTEGSPKGPPWNLKAIQRASPLKLKNIEALRNSLQCQDGVPFNFKIGILSISDLLLGYAIWISFQVEQGESSGFLFHLV